MSESVAILTTILGLIFYGLTIYRITVKCERVRADNRATRLAIAWRAHKCEVQIVTVERNHNPWKPTPWKRVDA